MSKKGPTFEFYDLLSEAFEHYNKTLFDGQLPRCLITVQRKKKVMGYFSGDRWANEDGKVVHEIALNPAYFARAPLLEVLQTLAHEMVHLWQHVEGTPSRSGYHNKEWAQKMKRIGLMPSTTGKPGGAMVGQKVNDYPLIDRPFLKQSVALVEKGFKVAWFDLQFAEQSVSQPPIKEEDIPDPAGATPGEMSETEQILNTSLIELLPESLTATKPKSKTKTKYTCPGCRVNLWGRPAVKIKCMACDIVFNEHQQE